MGVFFDQCPVLVKQHIKDITETSKFEDNEESVEKMAKAWLEKSNTFEERIAALKMRETDSLSRDDENGALVFTYSGSLIVIGPLTEGERTIYYTSIDMRSDVPKSAYSEDALLGTDINIDQIVEFDKGPIKCSSPVFKIAVFKDGANLASELEKLKKAAATITKDFVKINNHHTIILE